MSTCISREGEYSDHTPDKDYYCTRCYVLDEPALLDRVRELVAERDALDAAFDRDLPWRYTEAVARANGAEAERDAALSTIAKVEALHTSEGWPLPGGRESKEYCTRCNCRWPCPTIRALGSVPSTGEGNE